MEKLKNEVSIDELTDLLACLDRAQDDLKQIIDNRKRGYKDQAKESRLVKELKEIQINAENVHGGELPPLKIDVLD